MKISELIFNSAILNNGVYQINDDIFEYSDGDRAEKYIYEVLQSAKDISSQSVELDRKINDWTSRYHLSSSRANTYRAFNFKTGATVLEIGSGCGSITRYLGEIGLDVVAIEGSRRRSEITRIRTRDLTNVKVICGSFSKINFKTKFDYVICNGVLEYAPLFVESLNPADMFLQQISELVESDGVLFLAIENKLGLRYFTSCKEEHTGIMFDGIENYPRFTKGPKTHTKADLLKILNKYFNKVELLLPLPDYKFPKAVIREELTKLVECGELFGVMEDYSYPTLIEPKFHQRLSWHTVADAGLLSDLSNSHLFIASKGTFETLEKDWYGEIFKKNKSENIVNINQIISKKIQNKFVIGLINKNKEQKNIFNIWINGPSLHTIVASFMMSNIEQNSYREEIINKLKLWWDAIGKKNKGEISLNQFDAIWRNSIYQNNKIILIDIELESKNTITFEHMIYRTILNFVSDEINFIHRWHWKNRILSEYQLVLKIGLYLGIKINITKLNKAVFQEILIQINFGNNKTSDIKRLIRMYTPIIIINELYNLKNNYIKFKTKIINKISLNK